MAYNWDSGTITLQDKIDQLNSKLQEDLVVDLSTRRVFGTQDPYPYSHMVGDVFFIIEG